MKNLDTTLYFITDSSIYTEEEFLFRVEQALKGGATLLQLREKNKSTREYIELAEKVHTIAKRYNRPVATVSTRNGLSDAPAADSHESLAGVSYLLV